MDGPPRVPQALLQSLLQRPPLHRLQELSQLHERSHTRQLRRSRRAVCRHAGVATQPAHHPLCKEEHLSQDRGQGKAKGSRRGREGVVGGTGGVALESLLVFHKRVYTREAQEVSFYLIAKGSRAPTPQIPVLGTKFVFWIWQEPEIYQIWGPEPNSCSCPIILRSQKVKLPQNSKELRWWLPMGFTPKKYITYVNADISYKPHTKPHLKSMLRACKTHISYKTHACKVLIKIQKAFKPDPNWRQKAYKNHILWTLYAFCISVFWDITPVKPWPLYEFCIFGCVSPMGMGYKPKNTKLI